MSIRRARDKAHPTPCSRNFLPRHGPWPIVCTPGPAFPVHHSIGMQELRPRRRRSLLCRRRGYNRELTNLVFASQHARHSDVDSGDEGAGFKALVHMHMCGTTWCVFIGYLSTSSRILTSSSVHDSVITPHATRPTSTSTQHVAISGVLASNSPLQRGQPEERRIDEVRDGAHKWYVLVPVSRALFFTPSL